MIIQTGKNNKVITCYYGKNAEKISADGATFFEVEDVPVHKPNTTLHFNPETKEFYTVEIDPAIIAERQAKVKAARYPILVERYIREKYSLSAELAILRQRDTKAEEFAEYNSYAEECKVRAKKTEEGE